MIIPTNLLAKSPLSSYPLKMATITYCRENQISSGCLYTHALGILKLLDPDLTPGGERLTNYFIKNDPIFRYGDLSYNNSRLLATNLNNIAAEIEREDTEGENNTWRCAIL